MPGYYSPYVLARFRPPKHLLELTHRESLLLPGVRSPACRASAGGGTGFRRLSGGWTIASSGDLDSGSLVFALSRGSLSASLHTPGHDHWLAAMLLSP